jgi:hypothetical protein
MMENQQGFIVIFAVVSDLSLQDANLKGFLYHPVEVQKEMVVPTLPVPVVQARITLI